MTASDEENGKSVDAARYTPTQLLGTFKKAMISDEPHLNFDYLGLWADCERVLHDMYTSEVGRKLPVNLTGNVKSGLKLVDDLLRDAVNVQLQSRPLTGSAIVDAAAMLDDYIRDNAKKYTQPAFDQSSGRIPKALGRTFVPREPHRAISSPVDPRSEGSKDLAPDGVDQATATGEPPTSPEITS